MLKWLDRLTGRGPAAGGSSLAALGDYPPYHAPHIGPPTSWSLDQAQENLAHLVANRASRLVILGDWLRRHAGIDAGPALAGGDPRPLLDALHRWSNACWPAWHQPAIASEAIWLRSSRDGDERVYSLLLDVALLLGELVLQRNAKYQWALDLDPINERDGMASWRRAVLLLPAYGDMPGPIDLDLEHQVVGRYLRPDHVMNQIHNGWAETVMDAIEGRQEAAWVRPTA